MEKIREINLMDDKKLIIRLNLWAIPLLLFFFVFFTGVTFLITNPYSQEVSMARFLIELVMVFVLLTFHELIHGLFFKVFNPTGKVKFGFKNSLAYATSPGSFYKKGQFLIILLAPFLMITLGLTIVFWFGKLFASSYVLLASVHGAGCIGDFYFTYLVLRAPRNAFIEDTEQGISFYQNENAGN